MQDYAAEQEYSKTYKNVMETLNPTLSESKATLLQERKQQKQVDLGLFNDSRSATPKDGYARVNDSSLTGAVIPGVSSGYYPQELINQYQEPQQTEQNTLEAQKQAEDAYRKEWQKTQYENEGFLDKTQKFVTAIPAGFAKGVVELADVIQEVGTLPAQAVVRAVTGDSKYDIDFLPDARKEAMQEVVDNAVGYDRASTDYATGQAIEQLKDAGAELSWEGMGKLFTDPKQRAALGNLAYTAMVNPDIVSGSLAELGGGAGAGGVAVKGAGKVAGAVAGKIDDVAGAVSKEAKVAKAGEEVVIKDGVPYLPVTPPSATDIVNNISDALKLNSTKLREELAAVDRSGLSKAQKAAAVAEIEKTYTLGKATADMVKGDIMTNTYAANLLNNHIQQFKDNNNGEDPTIGKLAEMALFVKITSGTEVGVVKYALGIKTLTSAEKKEIAKASVAGTVASIGARLGTAGGLEGVQEVLEGAAEELNTKLNSADYEGKSAQEILQEESAKIIGGGVMGVVGGVQMKGAGMAAQPITDSAVKMVGKISEYSPSTAKSQAAVTTEQVAETPVAASKPLVQQYTNTLLELREAVRTNTITADTISSYIDKVESLYDIRTGIEGFTPEQMKGADDTYKVIANKFNDIIINNPELRLGKVVTPKVLGSAPTLDDRLNAEQVAAPKGETNATLAERVLTIALDTAAPEDVNSNAVKYLRFAVNNGISKEEAIQLVKNYASVEEEATVGDRGYKTYVARAKAIQTSDKPDEAQVNLVANKLEKFMVSVDNSASQLEDLINRAESVAAKYNKSGPAGFMGKTKERIKGEYKKLNGEPYSVDVVKKDGKWVVANDKQARSLLETKRRYVQEMRSGLEAIGNKRTDVPFNLGEFVVPVDRAITAGVKRSMANDKGFIDNSLEAASKLIGKKSVTRVIVDSKDYSDKWKTGSEYQRHNSEIINRDDYTSNDVVLVHGNGSFKNGASTLATTKGGSPEAAKLQLAIAAGSSIVLDRDFIQQKGDKKGTLNKAGNSLSNVLISKGYARVPGTEAMFVKVTEEVTKRLESVKKEQELRAAKKKELGSLVDITALLLADEQGVVALNPEAKTKAQEKYNALKEGAIRKYFSETDKEGRTPEEKLQSYLDREIEEAIQDKVEKYGASLPGVSEALDPALTVEHKKDEQGRPTNLGSGAIALAYLAKKRAEDQIESSLPINELLQEWKALLDKRLSTEETNKQLVELVRKSGMTELLDSEGNLLQLGKDLLEKSQSKGKTDKFEVTYASGVNTTSTTVADTVAAEYKGGAITEATKVAVDVNKFVSNKGSTLLSVVPVSSLPAVMRNEVDRFKSVFTKTVKGRGDGAMDNQFWLVESPGRAIVYNEKGTVSPQVMAAMWLTLMEMMKTDKYKLVLGARSKKDVAQQLNLPETMITKEQVEFAKKNGMLNKTVANSLGKAILAELGLGKKGNDEVAKGHYETLVADLGNMAIATAVKMGWLSYTTPSNTEVSKFYGSSENVSEVYGDKEVRFINISKSMVNEKTKELQGALNGAYKVYESTEDKLPVAGTARKEPFNKLTKSQVIEYTSSVRNDGTAGNHKIPAVAVETLEHLMTTDYTFDVSAAQEFVELVDTKGSTIKEQLGYIEINDKNPKYVELTFEAKDIQEGINRSIDKSIEELKVFIARAENGESYNVQFPFYYTSNGRYMMDSNTINPLSDKVHRFLAQPAAHKLTHTVTGEGGGATFTTNGRDTSYYVRVALAQAFGLDIDKLSTKDIIKAGNELLSLDTDNLELLKAEIVTKGKATLSSGLAVEAVHITHTLQGIKFLQDAKTGRVTSSLTAEFDSVTNGFMNKLMQLPVLNGADKNNNVREHLARVGILSKSYVQESINGLPPLVELLTEGEAINVILSNEGAARGLLDSYKNLASFVGARLAADKTKTGFDKLWEFLPKPEGEDNVVSSALRKLFKAPFMTFNYSASIKNIKESLSYELVDGLFTTMAKGGEEGAAVAKAMFAQIPTIHIDKKAYKGDAAGIKALIDAVRNKPSSSIRASGNELREILKNTMLSSYGVHVQDVFEKAFGPYIEIQDAINDAFRISYRLFEKEFNQELDVLQRSKKVLSEKDYKDTITKLWGKFPAIRGPLSEAVENGFDVIPVVSSKSSSGSGAVTYRDRAATVLEGAEGAKTRKQVVRAVMRLLEEAGKAGSVIPFHYIDGAEMGRTVNDLHGKGPTGVTAIHDALMVPLDQFDEATLAYNKNTVKVNKEYNLLEALLEMVNKWPSSVEIEKAKISNKGLITAGGSKTKEGKPTHVVAKNIRTTFEQYKVVADEYRDIIFDSGEFIFNNLVGTAGGMYTGNTKVDYSYLDKVASGYVNSDVKVIVEQNQEVLLEAPSAKLEGGSKDGIITAINNLVEGNCK